MVSFCSQDKVVTSRSETVVVTVEFWKELLQDMMLIVLNSVKQTFVGVFYPKEEVFERPKPKVQWL